MFEILLKSNQKFGVIMQSCNFYVDSDKQKKIVVEDTQDINFEFYFCNQSSLVYPACLQFDGTRWVTESKYISITKISEQKYICEITKNVADNMQEKTKKITINQIYFNFYCNGVVEIESDNNLLFCENFDFSIKNASVVELDKGYYALNLFSAENTEKTILINQSFASVMTFDNAIFEKTENGFKVLQQLFDIANHGLVQVYQFEDDIKLVDEYTVYIKNHALNKFSTQVLPIYFLQCVKANDFGEAKTCLADSIRQKVSNQGLKAYFGEFVDILIFEGGIYLKYLTNTPQNYVTKKCQFALQDGKISKIDLI